jgi:hypothetical protein
LIADAIARETQHEADHQQQQQDERPEVPRFKPFHRPPKGHQPEHYPTTMTASSSGIF